MTCVSFEGVAVSGLAAAVPTRVIDNLQPTEAFSAEHAAAVVDKTGIRHRRWAPAALCASDLCAASAERLLSATATERESVDGLIFVSQTPDYRMPATAFLLQHRLGLGRGTAAFDINLGCSGYVQGLMLAFSLVASGALRRVLLLNGETRTRAYSFRDKTTGMLFGDAGAATLVERRPGAGRSVFSTQSDGARAELIKIEAGGYRLPSSADSVVETRQADGGFRSAEQGVLDGPRIFEFLMDEVPKDVRGILNHTGRQVEDFDHFVFHQANRFMNEHLRRKLRLPAAKVPYSLDQFGNTSSVSIPLTLVTRLAASLRAATNRVLLCGFGVGLAWGSAVLDIGPIPVCDLVELGADPA